MQPPSSRSEDFLPHRPFPTRDDPERPAPRSAWVSRYVLPIVLFVVIVGAVAWMVQNMPKWKVTTPTPTPAPDITGGGNGEPVLKFTRERAQWEKGSDQAKESERGVPGFYDFPFRNVSSEDAELGLLAPSCDCVDIKVALLPRDEWARIDAALTEEPGRPASYTAEPTWHELKMDKVHGIVVPKDGQGVVRVGWNGRKDPGRQLNLTPKFWTQPKGKPAGRYDRVGLQVPISMASVVAYYPAKQSVGTLGAGHKGEAKFYLWSVTRDEVDVKVREVIEDPLCEVKVEKVPKSDWPGFLQQMENEGQPKPRLRCAFTATVTVYEKKDGKEMDLGPFIRTFRIVVDEVPQDSMAFQVYGAVRGLVEIGGEEQGKMKLKPFSVRQGTRETVSLWTDARIDLEKYQHSPAGLEVTLNKLVKESSPLKTKWRLEVVVPPNAIAPGTLPEDSAVLLRMANTNPPRLVRIPIVGHADAD